MEWIKITDAESIPLGVPLWFKWGRHVALLEPMKISGSLDAIALLYSHYMHVQPPPPPEED